MSRSEADYNQRNLKTLSALAENPSLKAGVGLLRETGDPRQLQQVHDTLAGQLRQIGSSLDYDFLLLQDSLDAPVAGVIGKQRTRLALDSSVIEHVAQSLIRIDGKLYEAVSVPINLGKENLGTLLVGREFDAAGWNEFGKTALILDTKILDSTFPKDRSGEIESQIGRRCSPGSRECEIAVGGETYLALPVRQETFKDGVRLVSFQSIDAATRDLTRSLENAFLIIGGCGVLLVMLISAIGAQRLARPLVTLIAQLRREGSTGGFSAKPEAHYQAIEVNELALEFTRAAGAIRDSERRLEEATEQFIESMAQAQDARDPYTAGHSERVSENSTAIALAMGLGPAQVEIIRIGAKLHDIGKIGIPDALLRKPGKLTREEYTLIQRHPQIGKAILEKVGRFSDFLPIVELHHENPDGSGYPYRLMKDEIPLGVRIVHVADVWDAITSDRSYREAMSIAQAWELIRKGTGPLFDLDVVEVLRSIVQKELVPETSRTIVVPQEMDHALYPCIGVPQ